MSDLETLKGLFDIFPGDWRFQKSDRLGQEQQWQIHSKISTVCRNLAWMTTSWQDVRNSTLNWIFRAWLHSRIAPSTLKHYSQWCRTIWPSNSMTFFAEHEPRDWCELPGFRLWEEGVLCSQSLEASSEATHRKHFSITQILENFVWPDCLSNIEGVDGGLTRKGCE